MTSKWVVNGLLIQDINDSSNCQEIWPYVGVGRYLSWPLCKKTDASSKILTTMAEEKWFGYYYDDEKFALAVVPTMEFVKQYIDVCRSQEMQIRVLNIETNRQQPEWQGQMLTTKFLGYDYATSQDFFSVLYDDLYGIETPSLLEKYRPVLNSNGLFDKEADLISYIEERGKALEIGFNLETHGDFCIYKISSVAL